MERFQGKVAVITGAASGIGRACAERLAQEGAKVVVADINVGGEQVAQSLQNGMFVHVDVSDAASVEAMIAAAVAQHGRIDVLMNIAGIDGEQAPIVESTIENWRKVIAINLDGVYFGLKYGIAAMLKHGGGTIINMASTVGLVGFPNIPSYTASKGGVVQLTRTAAIEYAAHGIRVNAICPTAILTPLVEQFIAASPDPAGISQMMNTMNPIPGMPVPADVAAAAAFLASDDARFITGIALPVDGGYTAR